MVAIKFYVFNQCLAYRKEIRKACEVVDKEIPKYFENFDFELIDDLDYVDLDEKEVDGADLEQFVKWTMVIKGNYDLDEIREILEKIKKEYCYREESIPLYIYYKKINSLDELTNFLYESAKSLSIGEIMPTYIRFCCKVTEIG